MEDQQKENLRELLSESARSNHPLSDVRKVAVLIGQSNAHELEALLSEVTNDDRAADRVLMVCSRAAELANSARVLAWARIRRGILAKGRGASERAHALIDQGFDSLDRLEIDEDETLLRLYSVAGQWLAERDATAQRFDKARETYARMIRFYRRAGAELSELRVVVNLLSVSISLGDLRSAVSHAFRLVSAGWRERLEGDQEAQATVRQLLHLLAVKLYELGEQGYEHARRIAGSIHDREHPDGALLLLLATTAFSAGDFTDSLAHLDLLISRHQELLPQYELWRLHHRKAHCLVQLSRGDEAQEEIQRTIQLNASNPYVRFAAAQIHLALGDLQQGIAELTETYRLATERLASSARVETSSVMPSSRTEYLSNLPIEDLRDFALISRAKCFRTLGDAASAETDLRLLVDVADETSQQTALSMLASWAEEAGDLSTAAGMLEQASEFGDARSRAKLLAELARVAIRNRDCALAVESLRRLGHKSMQPEKAVELLNQIPAEDDAHVRALKWRGYAKTEAGWPKEGLADLDAAIAAQPHDTEAYYLRALTRITLGIKPESAEWNKTLTMRSVREAMEDLYAALRIDEDYSEARRVLKWLVERAAANPEMYEIFCAGGTREGDLFRVFPELKSPLDKAWKGNLLGYKRSWSAAAASFHTAMEEFSRAGFEVLAARIHVRLADVYLRMLDMAKVAEHLKGAESLQFLVNRPLSRDVLEQYQAFVDERGPYEKPTLGREVEYAWIYDHTYFDSILLVSLRANYRHRVGDLQGALEDVSLLQPLLEHAENIGSVIGPEQALWIVAILRADGQYEEALRILDALESATRDGDFSFNLSYSRALILDVQGESQKAVESYEHALKVLSDKSRPVGIGPFVQYAASLQNVGRTSDALEVLEQIDLERELESERDRLMYERVAAYVYRDVGRTQDAIDAVERAVSIVERRRADISDPGGRRGWLDSQENLFSVGVDLYARAEAPTRAWELCELSKSRTLLDELEGRASVFDEHARTVAALDTIEEAIRIVDNALTGDDAPELNESLRVESIARLTRLLMPDFERIRDSKEFAEHDFDGVRQMLEERRQVLVERELQQREQAGTTASEVVDLTELKELLAD